MLVVAPLSSDLALLLLVGLHLAPLWWIVLDLAPLRLVERENLGLALLEAAVLVPI